MMSDLMNNPQYFKNDSAKFTFKHKWDFVIDFYDYCLVSVLKSVEDIFTYSISSTPPFSLPRSVRASFFPQTIHPFPFLTFLLFLLGRLLLLLLLRLHSIASLPLRHLFGASFSHISLRRFKPRVLALWVAQVWNSGLVLDRLADIPRFSWCSAIEMCKIKRAREQHRDRQAPLRSYKRTHI